jgi:hypothetical protein
MPKRVVISAFFPDVVSGHAWQEGRGEGSSLAVAIKRAVDYVLSQPQIKGRQLHSVKMTVAVEQPRKLCTTEGGRDGER